MENSEDPNFFVPIKVNILIMIDYSLEWEIILYTLELRSWVNFAVFTMIIEFALLLRNYSFFPELTSFTNLGVNVLPYSNYQIILFVEQPKFLYELVICFPSFFLSRLWVIAMCFSYFFCSSALTLILEKVDQKSKSFDMFIYRTCLPVCVSVASEYFYTMQVAGLGRFLWKLLEILVLIQSKVNFISCVRY